MIMKFLNSHIFTSTWEYENAPCWIYDFTIYSQNLVLNGIKFSLSLTV